MFLDTLGTEWLECPLRTRHGGGTELVCFLESPGTEMFALTKTLPAASSSITQRFKAQC